jgi:hypothetical protein
MLRRTDSPLEVTPGHSRDQLLLGSEPPVRSEPTDELDQLTVRILVDRTSVANRRSRTSSRLTNRVGTLLVRREVVVARVGWPASSIRPRLPQCLVVSGECSSHRALSMVEPFHWPDAVEAPPEPLEVILADPGKRVRLARRGKPRACRRCPL